MRYEQQEVTKVLDRAAVFFKEHAAELGRPNAVGLLDEVKAHLASHGAVQHSSGAAAKAGTQKKDELRANLRLQHMTPISRMAIARLQDLPLNNLEKFKVPPVNASDVALLTAASAMADVAAEYARTLSDEGLGDQFLDELKAATAALHSCIIERDNKRFARGRSTISIDVRVKDARRVLSALTAIVESRFASRPEIIGEWRSRIRISTKPGVPIGTVRALAAPAAEGGALKIA
jgi:hypothetical protein